MRVLISEPQSSEDDTMDEILSMDSTYFSPDETVRCDEMSNKIYVPMKKRDQYRKVRTLTWNFFLKFDQFFRSNGMTMIWKSLHVKVHDQNPRFIKRQDE